MGRDVPRSRRGSDRVHRAVVTCGRRRGEARGAGAAVARSRPVAYVDFDGVVVDSRPGIAAALDATLADAGFEPVSGAALDAVIGPPLEVGLATILARVGGDPSAIPTLVRAYRERYAVTAFSGTRLQPGITSALEALADRATLAIASSKPLRFTQPLIEALGIASLFAAVVAPTAEFANETKVQTLRRAIATVEAEASPVARAMIGDRSHDMLAASQNDCFAIGALWGYGDSLELRAAGADVLVATPDELAILVWERAPRA